MRNRAPGIRANGTRQFVESTGSLEHLDDGPALDRADQRRPSPSQGALEVRHVGIEVSRRPPKLHGQAYSATRSPVVDVRRGQRTHNCDL